MMIVNHCLHRVIVARHYDGCASQTHEFRPFRHRSRPHSHFSANGSSAYCDTRDLSAVVFVNVSISWMQGTIGGLFPTSRSRHDVDVM
jgi:hypothetical protein